MIIKYGTMTMTMIKKTLFSRGKIARDTCGNTLLQCGEKNTKFIVIIIYRYRNYTLGAQNIIWLSYVWINIYYYRSFFRSLLVCSIFLYFFLYFVYIHSMRHFMKIATHAAAWLPACIWLLHIESPVFCICM